MSSHEQHPEAVPVDEVGAATHRVAPTPPLELLVTELLAAVPEVRDSLLSAADALLDAAHALVDAAERGLRGASGPGAGGDAGPGQ